MLECRKGLPLAYSTGPYISYSGTVEKNVLFSITRKKGKKKLTRHLPNDVVLVPLPHVLYSVESTHPMDETSKPLHVTIMNNAFNIQYQANCSSFQH